MSKDYKGKHPLTAEAAKRFKTMADRDTRAVERQRHADADKSDLYTVEDMTLDMAKYEARPIAMYLHCAQCLKENARPQKIVCGLDQQGHIIVWCERHELLVIKAALKNPPQGLRCDCCE